MAEFINRTRELAALETWWNGGTALAMVWGRRRIGKSLLLQEFARTRASVFHAATRQPTTLELARLSRTVVDAGHDGGRALTERPFQTWDEALSHLRLVAQASGEPLLLVLDELPELAAADPSLLSVLRAWADSTGDHSPLRILLCGSAVRTMQGLAEERAPLFGRFGLSLPVHPFAPHEAALMLSDLAPSERAAVYGLLGGVPFYLAMWDTSAPIADNLMRLLLNPAGRLLAEGELLLATEGDAGRMAGPVLAAIGAGRSKFSEIADAIGVDPTRIVEQLVRLRLVERLIPITEDPVRSRRRIYRLADPFMAFWFSVIDRHRSAIERGLGEQVLPVVMASLDDILGPRFEDAFREHLHRLAADGALGDEIVAIGPAWGGELDEVDAVVLAGRDRHPVAVGEAKWARTVNARRIETGLIRKGAVLSPDADLRLIIAAREHVEGAASDTLTMTAADMFD